MSAINEANLKMPAVAEAISKPAEAGTKRKAVTPPNKSGMIEIPADLNALSKEQLIALVNELVNERSTMNRGLKKARTAAPASAAKSNVLPFASPVASSAPKFDVVAVKKRISKNSASLIKKAAHNRAKKPFTEIVECVPSEAAVMTLFDSIPTVSNSARMIKWKLNGNEEVMNWLGNPFEYIHPVKFDGKTMSLGGTRPKIYAFANYDSLEAKFEKKTNTLNLKFRSRLAGTGKNDGGDKPMFLYDKNGKQIMGDMDAFLSRYM
ncbi:predicted protein [Chaetoceros tenuissimus]|uniref:Uncharacterized protein n=1 Tax=Chaetoceros tenuissimus TaxID=426638 RepID=A0AAD3CFP3_9STRA|nr:predicted protein [Chaetoceros tenuissimus]